LVVLLKVEEKTAGGIIIPQATQDKEQVAQQIGYIVDAGEEAWTAKEMRGVKPGDAVLFPRYSGSHFPINGDNYWIMQAKSVLGKATKLPDFVLRGADSTAEVFGVNDVTT
jgi:chaperonin GroES